MMRGLAGGALAVAATLGGLALGSASGEPKEPPPLVTEFVEVPSLVAPIFESGTVRAYALVRVGLEVDARALHRAVVPPAATLADALNGFVLTGGIEIGPDGPDAETLREGLRVSADEALGGGAVRAFVMRLDVLPKGEVRGGMRRRRGPPASSSESSSESSSASRSASSPASLAAGDTP